MDEPAPGTEKRLRQRVRAVRPLLWWAVFVLVLLAIHKHQQWMEQTRLVFSVTFQGRPIPYEAIATLDGRPISSGDRLSLGSHTFGITHPKLEPFSTNLSIWYGEHNLGGINLKRAQGSLTIRANPPAARIKIRGPEFAVTLTNSTGTTLSAPTDRYVVEAEYSHWREAGEVILPMNTPASWDFTPQFGTVRLTCNQAGASFQLLNRDNELVEGGDLPSTIRDLPQGTYKVVAWHHGNRRDESLTVKAGVTNSSEAEFQYGAAVLETEPSGASVATEAAGQLGTTPLSLWELTPGRWQFVLKREGYEGVSVSMDITAQQTNAFRTNLVNINYARAIAAARQYLATLDYDRALAAATDALQAKPNDPDAVAAQKDALGRRSLREARKLGREGDYVAARKELESTLQSLPESQEAQELLADFKKRDAEHIEQLTQDRLERPKKVFDAIMAALSDAALFDSHELRTSNRVAEVKVAILNALRNGQPAFPYARVTSDQAEYFAIEGVQEFNTALATSAGRRKFIIVGGQTRDDETQILFKVLEYKAAAVNKVSLGNLLGAPAEVNYVPIDKSRMEMTDKLQARVKEGIQIVTERIQKAIGQ